jgi:hypothetical protein
VLVAVENRNCGFYGLPENGYINLFLNMHGSYVLTISVFVKNIYPIYNVIKSISTILSTQRRLNMGKKYTETEKHQHEKTREAPRFNS